jgi:hypothetical protein
MAGKLIPPPGIAPEYPQGASTAYCIRAWLDLMRSGDKLLKAGLRRDVGPEGDLNNALRQWYATQCEEHTQKVRRMLLELSRREATNAR